MGLGQLLPLLERPGATTGAVGTTGRHGVPRGLGERLGFPDMFERAFKLAEYQPNEPFTTGGLSVTPIRVPHYTLQTYAFRVENSSRVLAYSGDSAPCAELVEAARDADLFVCEATLLRGDLDGEPRGHLSLDEAVEAFEESGARRLLAHAPPVRAPGSRRLRARVRRARARRLTARRDAERHPRYSARRRTPGIARPRACVP